MDARLTAARLLDTDEPIGREAWPLACYVSEAIENEMLSMRTDGSLKGKRFTAIPYDDRFRRALRRAINNVAVYAEPWQLDIAVLRAALEMRRI